MRPLLWLSDRWASYKYRLTPWLALNLGKEAVRRSRGEEAQGRQVLEGTFLCLAL